MNTFHFKSTILSLLLLINGLVKANIETQVHLPNALQLHAHQATSNKPIEQSWYINQSHQQQLRTAQINQTITLAQFPQLVTHEDIKASPILKDIKLTRYALMAPGAQIIHISKHGAEQIAPLEIMAFSAAEHSLGLLVDKKTGDVTGMTIQEGISFNITGNLQTGLDFRVNALPKNATDASNSCMTAIENQPGDPLADMNLALKSHTLAPQIKASISYEAVLAIDTDTEWMAGKSNNINTAMNYINSLFVNMNVFFERDASLHFLMGNVTLRTNSDPYPNEPNMVAALTDFSEHWRVNESAVERDFAALLSGQNINANAFSGIAWIDAYCEKGTVFGNQTYGSYSVNRIGSNAASSWISQFLAHELGHNLGSPHTHCYTPAIDNCYNAEDNCFSGTEVCPAGGKGTIMSYCHLGACGVSNEDIFHPTVINLFNSQLASNSPSCIAPFGSDLIFMDGFDN